MAEIQDVELLPIPAEAQEEQHWNKWLAISKQGIVGVNSELIGLLEDLDAMGIRDEVTTMFNTSSIYSIEIY